MLNVVRAINNLFEQRMTVADFDSVLDLIASGGAPSYTGKLVSQRNALSVIAVWSCINILSDDFANLPLQVFRWLNIGTEREEARDHYLWPLLMDEANPRMSAFRFQQTMETWRLLWGNCFAEIEFNGRGQIAALWPWRADRVKVWLEDPNDVRSRVMYSYMPLQQDRPPVTLSEDHILHVRHLSLDGVTGMSPIEVHRQTVALSMAMQEHAGRFYGNGAMIKNVLKHPSKLSPKAQESLKESMKLYQGLANSWRMMILEEGMDIKEIGMPMKDAQYIESQNFTGEDICRIYKVPPHRAGFLSRSTNNNIEEQGMDYVQYTLDPIASKWIGEIHCTMLSQRERQTIFIEPDYTKYLMADHKSRGEYYTALTNASAISPDEIRRKEGYNKLKGGVGEMPRAPLNTVPMGTAVSEPKKDKSNNTEIVPQKTNGKLSEIPKPLEGVQ